MESVKELIGKLKKLDTKTYFITCQSEQWQRNNGEVNRYWINILDLNQLSPLSFNVYITLYPSKIVVFLGIGGDSTVPTVRNFEDNTYTEKEKLELKLTLEEIKEFSEHNLLEKFNSFLYE